jgi:16S rRNA processing protein RimM
LAADTGWIVAGRVARPHGLDGSFSVAEPEPALLGVGASVTVAGVARRLAGREGTDARPLVRLEGVGSRTDADALRGESLLVARAQAPALGDDEFWAADLERCLVVDGEREVGEVVRLMALPSCEVLEVRRAGASEEDDPLLVPLVQDAVRSVDVAARRIDVDLRFLDAD